MGIPTPLTLQNSYDTDYQYWLETTIEQLRAGQFSALDLDNLIEELESMGKTDLRTANSLIKQIILDKLPNIQVRKHWQKEINNIKDQWEDLLSSSLKAKIDLEKIYQRAKQDLLMDYTIELPKQCPYSLDDLLNRNVERSPHLKFLI